MADENLRRQWREATRRYRARRASAGGIPLGRGWSSKGKAHAPDKFHPWNREKHAAHEKKMIEIRNALAEDWDLSLPGEDNERYSRMNADELCAELGLHIMAELREQ